MLVSPSLLAANAAELGAEVGAIERAGAKYLHVDVMDGHFVPKLSFGPHVLAALRPLSELRFDLHLMVGNPSTVVGEFLRAGADLITVHLEACDYSELQEVRAECVEAKAGFGIAIRPDTPVESVAPWADSIELLLIMSIEPGCAGAPFQQGAVARVRSAASLRREHEANFLISVDGGINAVHAEDCRAAGADMVVAGSYVFGSCDRSAAIGSLIRL